MHRLATLVLVFFLIVPYTFAQTTRYVGTTGEDTTDCTSEGSPCATISYAIDQASPGDTIEIAGGEYTESLDIDKPLSLYGESEAGTIIQAHENPDEAESRVITIDGDVEVEIADVTIRHGVASGSTPDNRGGGIYSNGATLVVSNVTFNRNSAFLGGGMLNDSGFLELTNVTLSENSADFGAGMYNIMSSLELTNTTFAGNEAASGGGIFDSSGSFTLTGVTFIENTVGGDGGGITLVNSSADLVDVQFSGNVAGNSGGGIYNSGSSLTLRNVAFRGNNAIGVIIGAGGGGMFNADSSPELINVVFSDNTGLFGGGMLNDGNSAPVLTNVSFSGNSAGNDGGGMYNCCSPGVSPVLTNTVLWGNSAGPISAGNEIYNGSEALITLRYSLFGNAEGDIVEGGGVKAENSLTDDPLFVDAENGDLRLMEDSPAIDAGDPDTDPLIFPTNADGVPIDLDGNPRVFGEQIDIGAYENQSTIANEASPEEITEVLSPPSPNPVTGMATFTVAVERGQDVTIEVFDALGRHMQVLYEGTLAAGMSERLALEASALPAGVYVIRATGEDFAKSRRLTVVR